jgi:nifR3 family TIM-barrel protein
VALTIGPLRVDPPVVLAPMAGVTNAAFRSLCRSYGGGLFVSEMIMARALVEDNARTRRMVAFGADEDVRSVQLCGVDPAVVAAAVRILVGDLEVDHVDLNFGCPAGKVTRKGGGAALPAHPRLFGSVVSAAVRAAGPVPVTVKMRLGLDDGHPTAIEAGLAAEAAGAAAVTLHARTAEQLYAGRADWSAITRLKEAVTSIPVLGNGDLWEAADATRMTDETGCDGVVVGRGCLGRPWLFAELSAAWAGEPAPVQPDLAAVVAVMGRHASGLVEVLGEARAMLDFRKHIGWYLAGFPVGRALRSRVGEIVALDQLAGWLAEVAALGLPAAVVVPRGPVNGPRRVPLPDRWLETVDDPAPPSGVEAFASGG